jgi:crossover junction endodeoxyribonuclease RuvC
MKITPKILIFYLITTTFCNCFQIAHAENLINQQNDQIIKKYKPDILAVEKLFFTKNQKTAMQVAETRGMILFVGAMENLPIIEFTPLEIKIAITGYGKAEKRQVQEMVKSILKLSKLPKSDDEIDAIATALTCSAHNPHLIHKT